MNPRDPLTLRTARTVAETRRDAYDWWEGPAGERSQVVAFEGALRPLRPRFLQRRRRRFIPRLLRTVAAWLLGPRP